MALIEVVDVDYVELRTIDGVKPKKTNDPQFVCDICGQTYKHKSSLEIHIGIHNGISVFTCEYCGKPFTQKISLQRHLPIHTQIPQYTCNICDREFIHDKTYKRHMSTHTGQRPVHCSICNLGCDNVTQLKRHLRRHTKEKPFSCDVCGKCFSQKYNMYAHKRQLHQSVNGTSRTSSQRRCPLCDMIYERNKLAEHLSEKHSSVQSSARS